MFRIVKFRQVIFLSLVIAALLSAGCTQASKSKDADKKEQQNSSTRVVYDDLGHGIVIPLHVTRVVSLAPSVTENLFAAGAGDRVVGVTTYCNYPDAAKTIAKVGDTLNPNMETIVSLRPEIVFVSSASQLEAFTNTLEQNGIAVYVTDPTTLDGIFRGIEKFGSIFETEETVAKLLPLLENRVDAVRDSVNEGKRVRVFVQFSREPLFTAGKESYLNAIIEKAGGESVTANVGSSFPKLSKETAAALQPEVIILSDSDDNQQPNDAFRNSPAVKDGRVYKVNADILSRPGPRLVDALEQIAKNLHPKAFKAN